MISLIVLASGFGKRFGANKLLYNIDGKPMYRHIVDVLNDLTKHPVKNHDLELIVVTQYREIAEYVESKAVKCIINNEAFEGISASVRKGVEASSDAEWYFFFTADQPYLQKDTIENFLHTTLHKGMRESEAFEDKNEDFISKSDGFFTMASAHSNNVPGNPTGFNRIWREELLNLKQDVGGRKIMKEHPNEVLWIEIPQREREDIDFLT